MAYRPWDEISMDKKSEEELERIANQITAEMIRDLNAKQTEDPEKASVPEEETEEG